MAYEFREFPKYLYAEGKPPVIVQDREAEVALGDGWSYLPVAALKPDPAASGAQDPAAEKAAEESKSPWLARADAVKLDVDRRWSVMTLKTKVLEAEEKTRA